MASTTPVYSLVTGVVSGDLIEPDHHNRVADSLDCILGGILSGLLSSGAASGWEITNDKTVGPGCGLVDACWCSTNEAQAVSGLSHGAVSHVFACATDGSAPRGEVSFVGQTSLPGPGRSIYLGTITLDAEGAVAGVSNDAAGAQRQCHPFRWRAVAGAGVAQGVVPGDSVRVTIDHTEDADFRLPGALSVVTASGGFTATVWEHHRGGAFVLCITNDGGETGDCAYQWTREGILR